MRVLGLLGAKGSGKDTMASYLVNAFQFERIGFADELYRQVAQAYAVTVPFLNRRETKETALDELRLLNCADVQFVEVALQTAVRSKRLQDACLAYYTTRKVPPHASARRVKQALKAAQSPRWTLQLWGTEYRRASKYGVDSYWLDIVAKAIDARPAQQFVVTDVRFVNEARFVEQLGGSLMRIRRPALEAREAKERARNGTAAHPSEVELLNYKVPFEVLNEEGNPDSLTKGIALLGLSELAKAA